MPTTTKPLNDLEKEIYQRIISGKRMFSYWTPSDFVYVTELNKDVCIHYTMRFKDGNMNIYYVMTGENEPLNFKPETRKLIIVPLPQN